MSVFEVETQLQNTANIADAIVQGPATGDASEVVTTGGNVPTFAKVMAQLLDAAAEQTSGDMSLRIDLGNNANGKGASLVATDDTDGDVQSALQRLGTMVRSVLGTASQVIITATDGGATLTWSLPQNIDTTSDVQHRDFKFRRTASTMLAPNNLTTGSGPASFGTGAGTGASMTIAGDGHFFQITLTTGTSPAASANVMHLVFRDTQPVYATAPVVMLIPANRGAQANAAGSGGVIVQSVDQNGFSLQAGSTALQASATYVWNVIVHGV